MQPSVKKYALKKANDRRSKVDRLNKVYWLGKHKEKKSNIKHKDPSMF